MHNVNAHTYTWSWVIVHAGHEIKKSVVLPLIGRVFPEPIALSTASSVME